MTRSAGYDVSLSRPAQATRASPPMPKAARSSRWLSLLFSAVVTSAVAPASAAVGPGQPAPEFTLPDTTGKVISLASLRGRTVVLEWTNPGCPFVVRHYETRNVPQLQRRYGGQGVVWLAVNSTNPEHPDYLQPKQLAARYQSWDGAANAVLLDEDGKVGRAYGAKTTPQMVVIDPKGMVVYAGGIDDRPATGRGGFDGVRNHVAAALDEMNAGKAVSVAKSTPYGCSVKY